MPLTIVEPGVGGTGTTTSTGTGSAVLSNSPTLVTPTLGSATATAITTGLGNAAAPSITFTGNTNTGIFSPAADTIAFAEGGTEAMRINSSGGVRVLNCLSVGNATPSTSGAGITFPATQSASTDANTLDDYEEGTYTAAFFIISGSTSITYTRQEGKYTKIGNLVYATFTIGWSANSGSGGLVAVNMPFTNICNGPHGGFGTVSYAAGLPVNAVLYGDNNQAWAVLIRQNSANTYYGAGDIASGGGQIMGGFIYHTST